MSKYIDSEKLIAEIKERYNTYKIGQHSPFRNGKVEALREAIELITSLQQEQSHWKPSEEQIKALEYFIRSWGESGTMSPQNPTLCAAKSLLNSLKKL